MNQCKGLFGLIFGHKFVTQYSYQTVVLGDKKQSDKQPIGHMCVRCGKRHS